MYHSHPTYFLVAYRLLTTEFSSCVCPCLICSCRPAPSIDHGHQRFPPCTGYGICMALRSLETYITQVNITIHVMYTMNYRKFSVSCIISIQRTSFYTHKQIKLLMQIKVYMRTYRRIFRYRSCDDDIGLLNLFYLLTSAFVGNLPLRVSICLLSPYSFR